MEEKRKDKRVRERNKVKISLVTEDKDIFKGKILDSHSDDISMNGIKIISKKKIPINTIVRIELESKKMRKEIRIIGKVRWIKKFKNGYGYEVGMEFVNTTPEKSLLLLSHIYGHQIK